jgi:MEMO1 family protein
MALRHADVYATQAHPLRQQVLDLLRQAQPPTIEGDIHAIIVPDSNRLSGGTVAATVYGVLQGRQYDTVVLVAPSHAGAFRRMNVCRIDTYRTPLGDLRVNDRVRNELCDEDDDIYLDDRGHYHNQGVDVQLPFLQEVLPPFDIVPIVMGEDSPEFCRELGQAIGEVMYNRRMLLVASANLLDASDEALSIFGEVFETLDVSRLMSLVNGGTIRFEGSGAILVALIASLARRATFARIVGVMPPAGGEPGYVGALIGR